MGRPPKYGLEYKIAEFMDAARDYVFYKPKDSMDKLAHSLELISWILLTIAIILRIR